MVAITERLLLLLLGILILLQSVCYMAGHSTRMLLESLKNKKNICSKHGVYSMNMYVNSYKNTIDYTRGKNSM